MDARLIIANVGSDKLQEVEKRLERMRVERINVSKVKGFGEYHNFLAPNWLTDEVRIEVFTKKEEAEEIVATIIDAAHTGIAGDGVVAIVPIEKLYLVRTRSEAAPEDFWPRINEAGQERRGGR